MKLLLKKGRVDFSTYSATRNVWNHYYEFFGTSYRARQSRRVISLCSTRRLVIVLKCEYEVPRVYCHTIVHRYRERALQLTCTVSLLISCLEKHKALSWDGNAANKRHDCTISQLLTIENIDNSIFYHAS